MSLDFVAIDFETANAYERGSACAVGLTVVQNGKIVDEFSSLINPKLPFSPQCVRVHGINLRDVVDAPTFPQIWDKLLEMIGDKPLIAHNAAFDIPVLERLLYVWHLEPIERKYSCTLKLSRKLCSCAYSYRLGDLCKERQLSDFTLHNAGDDARACAQLCISLAEGTQSDSLDELLSIAGISWDTILTNNYFPEDHGEIRWPDIPTLKKNADCIRSKLFVDAPIFDGLFSSLRVN
jgi:DNA polymerase-3 subunit epsilon